MDAAKAYEVAYDAKAREIKGADAASEGGSHGGGFFEARGGAAGRGGGQGMAATSVMRLSALCSQWMCEV